MARDHQNVNWGLGDHNTWDSAQLAVLMDIRAELQTLTRIFSCSNFMALPFRIRDIQEEMVKVRKNTTKKKPKKKGTNATRIT